MLTGVVARIAMLSAIVTLPANAQTIDQEIKEEQLRAARLANAKSEASMLDTLRATTGGGATLTTPDKSMEASLLRYALQQGVSAELAVGVKTALGPYNEDKPENAADRAERGKLQPLIVMGSTPPSVSHWIAFENQRADLSKNLDLATERWSNVFKTFQKKAAEDEAKESDPPKGGMPYYFGPVAGILGASTIASTAISLFKNDTASYGFSVSPSNAEFEPIIYKALAFEGYSESLDAYSIDLAGGDNAQALLGDLTSKHDKARSMFTDEYLPILTKAEGKPDKIPDQNVAAAGQTLKALIEAYQTLSKSLYVEVGGLSTATMILREKSLKDKPRPLIYIISSDAALTMTTRKNITTGWATKPIRVAGVMNLTYVLVDPSDDSRHWRQSISCVIPETKFNAILSMGPETDPSKWAGQCAAASKLHESASK